MRYASVCDGIGAVHVAWKPLGWHCVWTAEIEPFAIAVVEHHWHEVNLGDITKITEGQLREYATPDVLVGGTPCQSFSVAGLRGGLDDPRGNLALRFLQLVGAIRPRWVLWENVPGVLSSRQGNDFATFLRGLAQCGYGWAYRILDAIGFGVLQSRRRTIVVASDRGWQCAVAALFDYGCLARISPKGGDRRPSNYSHTLTNRADRYGCGKTYVVDSRGLRTFTALEYERLQGYPDDYTAITFRGKPAADGPRHRALGNSMAVPVMAWLGRRIRQVDEIRRRHGD
jgi:DNA (cytosine-5)-methyltransferase 1